MSAADDEVRRARRFGWTSLAVWALVGLVLEAAHGFKLGFYLDDGLTRTLGGAPLLTDRADGGRSVGRLLRAGALLVPLGFALSALRHGETDPSLPIFLVPLGALALVAGLARLAWAAWRK